ncbi:MAG: DUF4157 domain-containing protein [Myxococcota bacterium]
MTDTTHATPAQVQAKPAASAPASAAPSGAAVQLKASLRGMGYGDQLAALSPGGPDVQMKGGGPAAGDVHAAAERGTAGAGGSLPHGDKIQAAFGRHDVSGVQAYTGGAAREASDAMGASAYASGDKVAFAGGPDLHTAAHEAAHVVQQRAGVSLYGGVGQSGDRYEQHADQVADAVVQGKSAEPILDTMAGGGGGGASVQRRAVQRLPSWLPGVAAEAPASSGGAPVQMDFKDDMKETQKASYDKDAPAGLAAKLTALYAKGYALQGNSGRVVYSKKGTFDETKAEVADALGVALGDNKIKGGAAKANDGASARELYAASVEGCTCNVRNFGSQADARGTIEIHVAGLILEFKNVV